MHDIFSNPTAKVQKPSLMLIQIYEFRFRVLNRASNRNYFINFVYKRCNIFVCYVYKDLLEYAVLNCRIV